MSSAGNIAKSLKGIGIIDIFSNSSYVTPNQCFIAITGSKYNGHNFIANAINAGAKAILHTEYIADKIYGIHYFQYKNNDEICDILLEFYRILPDNIYAITGTNGKTSVAFIGASILSFETYKAASVGTLGVCKFENGKLLQRENGKLTTPDIITLYRELSNLKRNGYNHIFLEVSSIGIAQGRLGHLRITSAGFTNFSQDHLDYHGTMDQYFAEKMKLFTKILPDDSTAIINIDDERSAEIIKACKLRNISVITYGKSKSGLMSTNITPLAIGYQFQILNMNVTLPLVGQYQISNLLCAVGLCRGYDASTLLKHAQNVSTPLGRMEVFIKDNIKIVIDFAHTDDALKNAILSLKSDNSKLFVVFGCGGNRDSTKRKKMGIVSSNNADFTIVTDDNPRDENPSDIRREIISGISGDLVEISDRKSAILYALAIAKSGDTILIAGKGHESGQIVKDQTLPYSDYDVIQSIL